MATLAAEAGHSAVLRKDGHGCGKLRASDYLTITHQVAVRTRETFGRKMAVSVYHYSTGQCPLSRMLRRV